MSVNEGDENMSVDEEDVCRWRRVSMMEMCFNERDECDEIYECEWMRWIVNIYKENERRKLWVRKFVIFKFGLLD